MIMTVKVRDEFMKIFKINGIYGNILKLNQEIFPMKNTNKVERKTINFFFNLYKYECV